MWAGNALRAFSAMVLVVPRDTLQALSMSLPFELTSEFTVATTS